MSEKEHVQHRSPVEKSCWKETAGVIASCLLIGSLFVAVVVLSIRTGAILSLW